MNESNSKASKMTVAEARKENVTLSPEEWTRVSEITGNPYRVVG